MRTIYLDDVRAILYIADEAPPVPEGAPPRRADHGVSTAVEAFILNWRGWSEHYHVAFTPSPADRAIIRRLLLSGQANTLTLEQKTKEFWFLHSDPLVSGEYHGPPFVLFAKFLKERHVRG